MTDQPIASAGTDASPAELANSAELAESVVASLRAKGVRMTVSRRLLIEELASAASHLSADEILGRIKPRAPDVHLATVYRNLEALLAADVITHVHLPHGSTTYFLPRPGNQHPVQVICRRCDDAFDIPGDVLNPVAEQLLRDHGFELDSDHVALTGHCRRCRQA